MFQFTTTNVLNSLKDLTTGKDLIVTQKLNKEGALEDLKDEIIIKRIGNFKKANVESIHYTAGSEAELAAVCMDLASVVTKDKKYRLNMYIGLTQGSADSRYANDLYHKGKAFSIDFDGLATAAETVAKLADVLKKYDILVYGDKQLNVYSSGTLLALEAVNEYQRFVRVNIEELNASAYFEMGDYKVVKSLDDLKKKDSSDNDKVMDSHDAVVKAGAPVAEGLFVGKEGFGTYSYLLHNLRLPTAARSGAFAWNKEESPVPGVVYDEFVIRYCANRGELGMNAVGDTVKSVTTHVIYVPSTLSTTVKTALGKVGTVTEDVKTASDEEGHATI